MPLGHVVRFLRDYMREQWDTLRHVRIANPAFGFLATLEKADRGMPEAGPTTPGSRA